jgi:hypothetical protein
VARELKLELHAHTDDDPSDVVPYGARELIDRAAALGYDGLAITLHDRWFDVAPLTAYAQRRGIVLLAGIERSIQRRHVLLINFSKAATEIRTFGELAALRAREDGLVIAPHPFYPLRSCLRELMDTHAELWDAVEVNALYTRQLDFNRRAIDWAGRHGTPLVGNSDVHVLLQMGTTYSLVEAAPEPTAICQAIRAGRVEVRTEPLGWSTAAVIFARMTLAGLQGFQQTGRSTRTS